MKLANKTLRISLKSTVAITATAILAASMSACGSDNATGTVKTDAKSSSSADTSKLSGNLAGGGASSTQAAQDAWKAGFGSVASGVTVSYDAIGSGGGVTKFTQGAYAFGGSDKALTADQIKAANDSQCKGGQAIDLPIYISPIAVVFNLKGVKSLNLSADNVAKIFLGTLTKWNDPAIAADNPGVTLPDLKIIPVHRSDASGTTNNFTDYLHKAAPATWTTDASESLPDGGQSGKGTSGLIQVVQGAEGTIGYADASQAGELGTVKVKVGDTWQGPTPEGAAAVVANSPKAEGREADDYVVELNRTSTTAGDYPIVLVSYLLACTNYADAATAANVKAYASYIVSQDGQNAAQASAGNAPLSADLSDKLTKIIDSIKSGS